MLPISSSRNSALNEILSYTYPRLHTGGCWYISFYAFDPAKGEMRRKRIKINSVGSASEKRRYASQVCHRLSSKLETGWNPWIEAAADKNYRPFGEALIHYRNYITKLLNDGVHRASTHHDYSCFARIMEEWNSNQKIPILYVYQFDRAFCVKFLDYVYLERENSPRTRNNYLAFLRSFSAFLVQHLYLKEKPTEGLVPIAKALLKKERKVIAADDMRRLRDWLEANNRHYLLLSYFLHYMLIRPKEIAKLRLSDISVAKQTVYIDDTISKNKKSAFVTMPTKIIELMLDLGYFNHPSNYYVFSKDFKPGPEWYNEKTYRDYWSRKIRPALKFPKEYKFYSLKDTGITAMLRAGHDALSVKEQARHSSLLMTDIYTPQDIRDANPILLNYKGVL
jgi:integrase